MASPRAIAEGSMLLGRLSLASSDAMCCKSSASPRISVPFAPTSPRPSQWPVLLGQRVAKVGEQTGLLYLPNSADAECNADSAILAAQATCEAFREGQRRRAGRQSAFEI